MRDLLLYIAARKFHVADTDCESLVHDALLSLLQTGTRVENPRAWLVAALCNRCRSYWRQHARHELIQGGRIDDRMELPDTINAERLGRELSVRLLLRQLPDTDREMLRLHYLEQLTAAEIALRMGTTRRYAEKRIVKAIRRTRALYEHVVSERIQRRSPVQETMESQ